MAWLRRVFGPAFRLFGPAKVEPPTGERWTEERGWHNPTGQ